MRAVILAAGEGSRLRPLTATKPKVMIKVGNKPLVEYTVQALAANGIKHVTMVVGYHRERVQTYFGDGRRFGLKIDYVFQESLLGTAHALAHIPVQDEDLLVLGGDNIVDAPLIADLLRRREGLSLVAKESNNPTKYGVLTLEGDRVVRIEEQPLYTTSEFVNTGVYYMPRGTLELVQRLTKEGVGGLTAFIQHLIDEGKDVTAIRSAGTWIDAVYPWDLLGVSAKILQVLKHPAPTTGEIAPTAVLEGPVVIGEDVFVGAHSVITGPTSIGDNVSLGPGCIIDNCIINDDVQIGPGAVLQNTVVAEGTILGARFTALTGPCDVRVREGYYALSNFGAVLGEDCVMSGGVTTEPGALVGNRVRVDPNRAVRGTIDDGTRVI
ncbi:MAG TPA: sugar phosphate nucleotidyltransferase [Candidatus Thermoplasmatota archaeon]|nr:sugar phosphate nucleotidyltransferase [Candidatus Thermoplasmatota archaeon]